MLTSADFRNSLKTTVLFALLTVPIGIALGLGLAVLAHQQLQRHRHLPHVLLVDGGDVGRGGGGDLRHADEPAGRAAPRGSGSPPTRPILQNPTGRCLAVAVITVWQTLGLTFILMSAGLQGVPDELLEAARVDGAGAWSRFWHVTLPMLSPTIFFAVVVGTIFAFQSFGQIDLLTQGGPLKKTNVLTYFIYDTLQRQSDPGKAAVLAIALFFITLVLAAGADPAARAAGVV